MAKVVAESEAVVLADGGVAARQASAEEMAGRQGARSQELRRLAACVVAQRERREAEQLGQQAFEFRAQGALPAAARRVCERPVTGQRQQARSPQDQAASEKQRAARVL